IVTDAAPTPAIAYAVMTRKTAGAINFTASHNPPEYNGIKFSTPDGAPALPDVTRQIEQEIETSGGLAPNGAAAAPEAIEIRGDYLKRLSEIIDFKTIASAKTKVIFD